MVHHHHPWFFLIDLVLKNIKDNVGDGLDNVTVFPFCSILTLVIVELWLEVLALTFKNVPVVKTSLCWE